MNISVRDQILLEAYPTINEGLKNLNLHHVELMLHKDFSICDLFSLNLINLSNDNERRGYKALLDEENIIVDAILTDYDLSIHPIEASIQWFKDVVFIANHLGAKVIRVDSHLSQEFNYTFAQKVALFTHVFTEVLSQTQDYPVSFGVENHGKEGNNPVFLLTLINEIAHPNFGITLDFANFYWRGYPLSEVMALLKLFAPYTKHTHIKNICYPESVRELIRETGWEYETYVCPLHEGDIDIEMALIELKKQKYNGGLCIEDESLGHFPSIEQKQDVLRQDVEYLVEITNDIQFDN